MAATATPEAALGSAEAEAAAPETGRSEAATQSAVTLVKGEATVLRADESSESLDAGAAVGPGEVFKTGSETVLGMNLAGHIEVAMGANSVLALEILSGSTSSSYPATQLSIPEGQAAFVGKTHADAVLIETPGGGLSVGQVRGCVRMLSDGRVELVLFAN